MTPPLSRRSLIAGAAMLPFLASPMVRAAEPDLAMLTDITRDAKPIDGVERRARLARAQGLMKANGIGAVLIEPGSSMTYFTGVRWGRSERPTLAILPVEGDPCIVTPYFEEPSVRQTLAVPATVWGWDEDESPFARIADFIDRMHLLGKPIAIEETVRFFVVEGLRKSLGDLASKPRFISADAVVRGCRMIKSPGEIALMRTATEVTTAAYRWVHPRIEKGMAAIDIAALMNAATRKLGGSPEFALVLIGEAAAYPHGSRTQRAVAEGEIVLMDCGCTVEGYQSDVSRTFVHGAATRAQRMVWDQVHRGQQIAFAAARIGAPAGSVDDAVRRYYVSLGYGPGYSLPGLPHRTGHGIGLDGHEPVNLVRGEATELAAGMCFSNEPGLYLPGRFGVRLEDCFYMTKAGPRWFSEPPASIDRPV